MATVVTTGGTKFCDSVRSRLHPHLPQPPQNDHTIVPTTEEPRLTRPSAHCYKRSAFKSSLYVLQDFVLLAGLVYGAYHIDSFLGRL
jgi:hypothetical protein